MEQIMEFVTDYFKWISIPSKINLSDILEIIILAFVIYQVIKWIKDTRAWMLVKGIIFLLIFCLIAVFLELNVILFLVKNTINVGIIAVVIIFQPELRKALEELGKKNLVPSILGPSEKTDNERFSGRTIDELVSAVYELAKTKTGALIVVERTIRLTEYERTGIMLDSSISSQLLMNIFEHNTPLHDGAVIIRGDRIVAATCYLPLSENMALSKELGTRHRAGVGISEAADSLTIIVSEETGKVSSAIDGKLYRSIDGDYLRSQLAEVQKKSKSVPETKKFRLWKGRKKD